LQLTVELQDWATVIRLSTVVVCSFGCSILFLANLPHFIFTALAPPTHPWLDTLANQRWNLVSGSRVTGSQVQWFWSGRVGLSVSVTDPVFDAFVFVFADALLLYSGREIRECATLESVWFCVLLSIFPRIFVNKLANGNFLFFVTLLLFTYSFALFTMMFI